MKQFENQQLKQLTLPILNKEYISQNGNFYDDM